MFRIYHKLEIKRLLESTSFERTEIEDHFYGLIGFKDFQEINVIHKLCTMLMKGGRNTGKLQRTELILQKCLNNLEQNIGKSPIEIMFRIITNSLMPVSVRNNRKGSINVTQRVDLISEKAISECLHQIVSVVHAHKGKTSILSRLNTELMLLYNGSQSSTVMKNKANNIKLANDAAI